MPLGIGSEGRIVAPRKRVEATQSSEGRSFLLRIHSPQLDRHQSSEHYYTIDHAS
jgi:hypothetical protein